jgi:PAS domain S-box-containing protein
MDVTEQVLSRIKIQESEERYRFLFDNNPLPMWVFDLETFAFLSVNDATISHYGYSREEFLTMTVKDIRPPEDVPVFLENVAKDIPGIRNSGVLRHIKKDGTVVDVEITTNQLIFNGKKAKLVLAHDVTERKWAEQLILESEEKYRSIVETANEGIWLTDINADTTYVNRQMAEMLGYTVDEMLGRPIFDFIFEDDFSAAKHKINERIEGDSETNEFRLQRKDGSEIFTQYNASPIRNQAGEIVGFLSMNTDITERKKAEKSIRFQAHLLNTVEQAVIATDLKGIVIFWNQFAEKLYGWTSTEAVGHHVLKLTTPEINLELGNKTIARLSSGKSWAGEFVVQNKAGDNFPAYVSNSPVNDETGKIVGFVGVSVDITERKNAETALRQAEDKYRSLVESSPAIVYLAEPFPPFSTIYVSPNISRFGYSIEEWFNQPDLWVSIIHEDDRGEVLIAIEDAIARNIETDIEYRVRARDGRIHWLHDKGRFISDNQGNKTGWQGVMVDITKTKDLEEQLRQSQKLESIGLLAGGIAHDFNNMLTAINGYSDLALRRLKPDDSLRRYIEEIKKAGERSAVLTHQLLAFSRQQILQPKVIYLNQVVTETGDMLERLIGEDIQLVTILHPKAGPVNVDPGQIAQVVMNLAVNARDAMPNGGKLTIETANVYLDEQYVNQHGDAKAGEYVLLAVSDTGTGIDEATRQHIFEPFYTTKEIGQGTGLGLATVYGIVKQSGGNIWVYSELGIGTTFKVYLPRLTEESETAETKGVSADLPSGTETILLVEDEDVVRTLSRQILEMCGYTVLEATNGTEALTVGEKHDGKIDLLMTDVVMPKMGGKELAEIFARRYPQMRVLFTSGYTDDAVIRHGVINADTNFIQKPFTPNSLAHKVREVLNIKSESPD